MLALINIKVMGHIYRHTWYAWAAPRIFRWGYKTGFASGGSEEIFFVPPHLEKWGGGTSKQILVGAYY